MRASRRRCSLILRRAQSHLPTRATPSTVIVLQPVSSHWSQAGTPDGNSKVTTPALPVGRHYLGLVTCASPLLLTPLLVCLTRSVGDDLTSAVLRRCSQSSMPRASSRLT